MIFPGLLKTGLLYAEFPDADKTIWDFDRGAAVSPQIPMVTLQPRLHPGLIGCAPDTGLLAEWNRREREYAHRADSDLTPLPPEPRGALLGGLTKGRAEAAREAARTTAHRENGGNADIKELGPGSKLYLPVRRDGGKLSVGDLHFSMGDGEITAAVEMAGWIRVGLDLIRGGVDRYGIQTPVFKSSSPPAAERDYRPSKVCRSMTTTGSTSCTPPSRLARPAGAAIAYLEKLG